MISTKVFFHINNQRIAYKHTALFGHPAISSLRLLTFNFALYYCVRLSLVWSTTAPAYDSLFVTRKASKTVTGTCIRQVQVKYRSVQRPMHQTSTSRSLRLEFPHMTMNKYRTQGYWPSNRPVSNSGQWKFTKHHLLLVRMQWTYEFKLNWLRKFNFGKKSC